MDFQAENAPLKSRRIAKCAPIDIEFQDLTYSVRDGHVKGGWRKLLKGVNGIFKSGELTAIMGPSGAGKSTLLNILAGYVSAGVKGTIRMNDRPRDMKIFNKLSSYIMQDDIVQPRLSVKESMMIAAHLKLGSRMSDKEKSASVEEICKLLGLEKCFETRSEYLSGGQRKRLSVALELVNNPPVIFLDEPTTGLDNYAIKQCMDLLYDISKEGRTIICTIHQPPTSIFQSFDQVYVLANGLCVYNGSPSELVPFLSNAELNCPQTYTPADYIMEVVSQFPETIQTLSNFSENGKYNMRQKIVVSRKQSVQNPYEIYQETTQMGLSDMSVEYPMNVWQQFWILLKRMMTQTFRNKSLIYIQFIHHFVSAVLISGIFFGIGNKASQMPAIFKFCIGVAVFFMYTYAMTAVLLFPLEVKLLRREYFNRWYSLKAYYMAATIGGLPFLILFGLMFLAIVYFSSNQPLEIDRFVLFSLMGISVGLCSQGLGTAIGSICNILNGSIVGPSTLAPLLAFAVYGMGYQNNIQPYMQILMGFSFVRYGLVGLCNSVFSGREPLECTDDEMYCHFRNPEVLLKEMGMEGCRYEIQIIGVIAFMILFRIAAYAALRYRMSAEFSTKIAYYATKIINPKERF